MSACRAAWITALGGLSVVTSAACREAARPDVPALTTARPVGLTSPRAGAAGAATAVPEASQTPELHPSSTLVAFLEGVQKLDPPVCSRLLVAAVRGTVRAGQDTLSAGDVLVVVNPEPIEVKAIGALAVRVEQPFECSVPSRPPSRKTIVRSKEAPELMWAGGAMHAHLDVGTKVSPDLYLGRLEGTAPVPEHQHPSSSETLVAIEAAGTYTLDGHEARLGPRQIVHVPKGTRHTWKPDPGSKLVAIQIFEPPGPEQRFITLSNLERDGGNP